MRLIKARNTRPELELFSILEGGNVQFERHVLVNGVRVDALVDDRIAVFVDSPFWHLRDLALLGRLSEYWCSRLLTNRRRDKSQTRQLRARGYSVIRFWTDELGERRVLQRLRVARAKRSNMFAVGRSSPRTKSAD
jgi:DNA mismatch endonuclease (patch repair protein)